MLQALQTRLENPFKGMEYGWTNPKSLVVLVPGLSEMVYRIQRAHFLNQSEANQSKYSTANNFDAKYDTRMEQLGHQKRFITVRQWHAFGAGLQGMAAGLLSANTPYSVRKIFLSAFATYSLIFMARMVFFPGIPAKDQ